MHPPHTTFLPHTGFFFSPQHQPVRLGSSWHPLVPPAASSHRVWHQEGPWEAPGQLHGPKETPQRVGRLGEMRANSQGMGLGFW